jgi:DNA polymerase III epsilon subunit-like protein
MFAKILKLLGFGKNEKQATPIYTPVETPRTPDVVLPSKNTPVEQTPLERIRESTARYLAPFEESKTGTGFYLITHVHTTDLIPSGLNYKSKDFPRMVSIAWILLDEFDNIVGEPAYYIVKGDAPSSQGAFDIHQVSNEMRQNGTDITVIISEFRKVSSNTTFFIGFPANFTKRIIQSEAYRLDKALPILTNTKIFCLQEGSAEYYGDATRTSFGDGITRTSYSLPSLPELAGKCFLNGVKFLGKDLHTSEAKVWMQAKTFQYLDRRGVFEN